MTGAAPPPPDGDPAASDPEQPRPSLEEVRAELRALGYLTTPSERFFLAGLWRGSFWRLALRVSGKEGLLAGGAAAALLTCLVAVVDRAVLAHPRDLAVLFLYLLGAGFAVVAGLQLLQGCGLAVVAALRPQPIAHYQRAAAALGSGLYLACFGGFVLWARGFWRLHGREWPPGGWLLVVTAVVVSLLLGRWHSFASLALLVRLHGTARLRRRRRWEMGVLAGLVALCLAGLAGWWAVAGPAPRAPAEPFRADGTGVRVLLVGVDGLDLETFRAAALPLPAWDPPRPVGAYRLWDAGRPPAPPPSFWTTVATGMLPDRHRVGFYDQGVVAGLRGPISAANPLYPLVAALHRWGGGSGLVRMEPTGAFQRQEPTVWELLAGKGRGTGVVNWWASYPVPDAVPGFRVSDQAIPALSGHLALPGAVAPVEVEDRLVSLWEEAQAGAADLLAQSLVTGSDPAIHQGFFQAAATDRFAVTAVLHLGPEAQADLLAVYLPGLDLLRHTLAHGGAAPVPAFKRFVILQQYWAWLAEALVAMQEALGPDWTFLLVGSPGRVSAWGAEPRPKGVFLGAGWPLRGVTTTSQEVYGPVSADDVAPTALAWLGFPVSAEFPGVVLTALTDPAFLTAHPVRTVAGFGPPAAPAAPPDPAASRAMEERLRSLGYIQ